MREYTVEFRIEGENLVPAQVTQRLGMQPSLVRHVGEPRGTKDRFGKALWAFSGDPLRSGERPAWRSLEEGLRHVAVCLEPKAEILRDLLAEFDGYWWCGYFEEGFGGETRLSPAVMALLAQIGAPLVLDAYFESGMA